MPLYLYGLKPLKLSNKMFWVFVGNKKDLIDLKMPIVNHLGFFLHLINFPSILYQDADSQSTPK